MSNEKEVTTGQPGKQRLRELPKPVTADTDASVRVKNVEVVNLEIDENYDLGGDPYNHTGSHCVVKLSED